MKLNNKKQIINATNLSKVYRRLKTLERTRIRHLLKVLNEHSPISVTDLWIELASENQYKHDNGYMYVTQDLKLLRNMDLVKFRKSSYYSLYEINEEKMIKWKNAIHDFFASQQKM